MEFPSIARVMYMITAIINARTAIKKRLPLADEAPIVTQEFIVSPRFVLREPSRENTLGIFMIPDMPLNCVETEMSFNVQALNL